MNMQHAGVARIVSAGLAAACLLGATAPAAGSADDPPPPWAADPFERLNAFPRQREGAWGGPVERPQGAPAVQNPTLGVNFANYFKPDGTRAEPEMRAAGVSYDRITFDLQYLQSSPGGWRWTDYDALVNDAAAAGVQVSGVLISSSGWAADPGVPSAMFRVPAGLDRPWNDAANVWGTFVYQTVLHYKARVHSWEVWNEPNLGEFWPGSAAQFAQLLKVSYRAIKAADPSAVVVSGGVYREANPGMMQATLRALAADPESAANHGFFDVLGYHLYDGGVCTTDDEIGRVRQQVSDVIGAHPLWVTETGIRVWDNPLSGYALPDEQAAWLIQNFSYSLHAGAGRYYFFRAIDPVAGDIQPWGLLRADGSPRPAYYAARTAAAYLPNRHEWSVRVWYEGDTISRITFYNTNLGRVSVLWNTGHQAQTLNYGAMLSRILTVKPDGSTGVLTSANGRFNLRLEAAKNFRWNRPDGMCQVAGDPLIVIEQDTTPPVAKVKPLPATTASQIIELAWDGSDPGAADSASGLWAVDLQYRMPGGAWTLLREWIDGPSVNILMPPNADVGFRVRGHDRAGNVQDWATAASTTIRYVPR